MAGGHLTRIPIPEGLELRARTGSTVYALARDFGLQQPTVQRMLRELGIKYVRDDPRVRPMPDDFAQWAAQETNVQLVKRYTCTNRLITRWRKETGVRSPHKPTSPRPKAKPYAWNYTGPKAPRHEADGSLVGRAADHLRRCGWVVFRSRTRDAAAPIDEWRVGVLRLSTSELIAKAGSKGFVADAWRTAA